MKKIKTMFNILIHNPNKIIRILGGKGVFNFIPDKPYLKMVYYFETGKKLNLKNPKRYNEKVQWRKLYDRKPKYSMYVDKYEVRNYIKDVIGDQYLIPLIKVYDSVEEINWNELPDKFVLKCTHGSSSNIICKDKTELDIKDAKRKLRKWMKYNWYWFGREWPYKNIKPRIICEQFITDTETTPDDYKVMCFNGQPEMIQIHRGRFEDHQQLFYDINGNILPFNNKKYINSRQEELTEYQKQKIKEMCKLAKVLSKDTIELRVDFYLVNNKIYFGELTFFDASGFDNEFVPDEYNEIIGDKIKIYT